MTHIDKNLIAQLTPEERKWYKKFQNGLMFFSGWKQISEEIISSLPPEDQPAFSSLLKAMGVRIGTEWSKDNRVRKIDTDQLCAWGDRMRQARNKGAQQIAETIKTISAEVEVLLEQDSTTIASRNS